MPRPSELSFDHLNGLEVLEILHTRFYDLLHDLPELQERFTLTQAKLRLEIVLDIWGATPPKKIYHDALVVRVLSEPTPGSQITESHHELSADVDARENPPDLVREEHGLPLPRAVRNSVGVTETSYVEPEDLPKYPKPPQPTRPELLPQSLPANQASPNQKQIGRRVYATWTEQDYGSLQQGERTGGEGPAIGGEKISGPKSDATNLGLPAAEGDSQPAPPQVDFRVADFRGITRDADKPRAIVEETIVRGQKIDRELDKRRQTQTQTPTPKPKGRK